MTLSGLAQRATALVHLQRNSVQTCSNHPQSPALQLHSLAVCILCTAKLLTTTIVDRAHV